MTDAAAVGLPLSADISIAPDPVAKDAAATVTWSSANAASGAVSCAGAGVSYSNASTTGGSATVTPDAVGTLSCSFTVQASGTVPTSLVSSHSIDVLNLLTGRIRITPKPVMTASTHTLTWSSENATSGSVSCSGVGVTYTGSGTSGSTTFVFSNTGQFTCTLDLEGDTVPATLSLQEQVTVRRPPR